MKQIETEETSIRDFSLLAVSKSPSLIPFATSGKSFLVSKSPCPHSCNPQPGAVYHSLPLSLAAQICRKVAFAFVFDERDVSAADDVGCLYELDVRGALPEPIYAQGDRRRRKTVGIAYSI